MPNLPPLVDIHCHLLPAIDDGATDWETSLEMARLAVADGISTIVATPHQLGSYAANHGDAIRQKTAELQETLYQRGIPLCVLPGADVRIEPDMLPKMLRGEVLTLADRRRHVLLELPHEVYLPLEGLLSRLAAAGIVGILSHPERNQGILHRPEVLDSLAQAGCLFQITAGALVGTFGSEIERFAQGMVRRQLVHFVSTDAHGVKSRRPLLQRAFRCVAELTGEQTALDVCCRNPAAVVAGESVAEVRRESKRAGLAGWFRWNKAG